MKLLWLTLFSISFDDDDDGGGHDDDVDVDVVCWMVVTFVMLQHPTTSEADSNVSTISKSLHDAFSSFAKAYVFSLYYLEWFFLRRYSFIAPFVSRLLLQLIFETSESSSRDKAWVEMHCDHSSLLCFGMLLFRDLICCGCCTLLCFF